MVPIKVSTAIAGGPIALITSGLSTGDQVVIDGQLKLRPGVTVKAAAAAPAATAEAPPPAMPASAPAPSRAPP
jgi:multidrug efflux pump subunit AcrA (membrane-fusion protein)